MTDTTEASKPRKGEPVHYEGKLYGTVSRVEGNICHVDGGTGQNTFFLWRFVANPVTDCPAQVNRLFSWPSKVTP